MKKKHRIIEFKVGTSLGDALQELKIQNVPACGTFHDVEISSEDDLDTAYFKVFGKSKSEIDKEFEQEKQRLIRRNEYLSQNSLILDHLLSGNGISPVKALKMFGCFRLASRINDLRNQGLNIYGKMVEHAGKRFKVYYMENSNLFEIYGRNF